MKGDYKTGKRININKLIPYIASSYRKDKIWLRRTKASKRNYQILLCIDDSFSMGINKANILALESLALLVKSLTSLEIGEISVMKFGEKIELLHDFNNNFNDFNGSYIIEKFNFKQKQTNWKLLLENTMNYLNQAKLSNNNNRNNSNGIENVQLCFIISDARIQQDRENLRNNIMDCINRNQ
ncbi:unnamed protein product, partial [Adineta steineri]